MSQAQKSTYWHQFADYQMNIDVDVEKFQYKATQKITYTNNSPDVLDKVFYHLYLNAFQPNSEMDIRLKHIADPDRRMVKNIGTKENPIYQSRISDLTPSQIGYIKINSLKQNGKEVKFEVTGTILKVILNQPIKSGAKAIFEMDYSAQIPEMIRRSGRNNPDGVALSMTQWYPKLAEYDVFGWRTAQYIVREFHGVWGNFDVKINIDKKYIIGGSGVLQSKKQMSENKQLWHFKAKNVHDFSWAADPDFKHDILRLKNGKTLQFYYKKYDENWRKIQEPLSKVFDFFEQKIGQYPWETYSFIQGGDGGMEYAMCTLVAGGEVYERLLNTSIHELGHAWFQHTFASDELIFPWFDEGFTSYIEDWANKEVIKLKTEKHAWEKSYNSYIKMVTLNKQESPMTHADRYNINYSYSVTSYDKGDVFVAQLGYILGEEVLEKVFKQFYKDFALKHCTPLDFIRTAEKVSGLQLYWYLNEFMQTERVIDYSIKEVSALDKKTKISFERIGQIPMPLDIKISLKDGKSVFYHIPSALTFGHRPLKNNEILLEAWGWANPIYEFEILFEKNQILSVEIDHTGLLADVDRKNNIIQFN